MKRALVVTTCLIGATNSFVLDPARAPAALCSSRALHLQAQANEEWTVGGVDALDRLRNMVAHAAAAGLLASSLLFTGGVAPAWAENELSAKYGGGLDASLVDQTCLVDRCGTQAKACLADDPSCRKGLTCTAKCLGDNACITGCMARYGDKNLDNLLKCTIEDHECIKVAILPGGADEPGQEPRSPAPTVRNFDPASLRGSWYKVVGYNPNYDCYACQRNSFSAPIGNAVAMDVEFSMPHLLPDGSPPPPTNARELIQTSYDKKTVYGPQSIGLNEYSTRETMIFDNYSPSNKNRLVLHKGTGEEVSYARTAHSEGEMFGLSKCDAFWFRRYIPGARTNVVSNRCSCVRSCRILGELVYNRRERPGLVGRVQVRCLQRQNPPKHVRGGVCVQPDQRIVQGEHDEGVQDRPRRRDEPRPVLPDPERVLCRRNGGPRA